MCYLNYMMPYIRGLCFVIIFCSMCYHTNYACQCDCHMLLSGAGHAACALWNHSACIKVFHTSRSLRVFLMDVNVNDTGMQCIRTHCRCYGLILRISTTCSESLS